MAKVDVKHMDKPSVLYHASDKTDIAIFYPANETPRFKGEQPFVFATPHKAVAAMFLAPRDGDKVEILNFSNRYILAVNGTTDRFNKLDKGGAIYSLPVDSFSTDGEVGMGETEWVSAVPVTPASKHIYDKSLDAMKECGVEVYFVDDETFCMIQTSTDHGLAIFDMLKTPKLDN